MSDSVSKWGMMPAVFMVFALRMHIQVAHLDAQTCHEPERCAGTLLLADHPDDWHSMDIAQLHAWTESKK